MFLSWAVRTHSTHLADFQESLAPCFLELLRVLFSNTEAKLTASLGNIAY